MCTDAQINWEALRMVLDGDIQIYSRLASQADYGAEGNAHRERYANLIEQASKMLRSMKTIEECERTIASAVLS